MLRTRVLVVDDAVVVRRIVTDAIGAAPGLEVVGTAPNGRIALSKIEQLNPDLVTLDIEMPEMDGIATLTEIRARYPRLPVIMFSTLTERGAAVTMEALLRGANDYVTKPANVGSVAQAKHAIREQLVPKIHALCGTRRPTPRPLPTAPASRPATTPPRARRESGVVDAVVIGVSTGGPNALAALVPALPADLGVPVLIVQHMPPMFTRLLAERLDAHAPLSVAEATDGEVVRPGRVLIAPGDRHLEVRRRGTDVRAALTQGPPENSCRPAADVLFRTAAATWGERVLGVVLTGMGYDARRGAEHIRHAGGHVLAQDRASSVVWGMPGAVVQAELADAELPLAAIADEVVRRVQQGAAARRTTAAPAGAGRGTP
jgi:two-component system chemotaxis response regulator CheB